MLRIAALLALVLTAGCSAHATSRKKLAEAVNTVNDAARWGRVGTLTAAIEPQYWPRFLESRRDWGDTIQLADAEVLEVQMASGEQGAVAVITYSWYELSTMTLHTTVVQQRWQRVEDDFMLSDEQVVKGDAGLFARAIDQDAGGETAPAG